MQGNISPLSPSKFGKNDEPYPSIPHITYTYFLHDHFNNVIILQSISTPTSIDIDVSMEFETDKLLPHPHNPSSLLKSCKVNFYETRVHPLGCDFSDVCNNYLRRQQAFASKRWQNTVMDPGLCRWRLDNVSEVNAFCGLLHTNLGCQFILYLPNSG